MQYKKNYMLNLLGARLEKNKDKPYLHGNSFSYNKLPVEAWRENGAFSKRVDAVDKLVRAILSDFEK